MAVNDNRGKLLPADHPLAGTTVIIGGRAGLDPRVLALKEAHVSRTHKPQSDVPGCEPDGEGLK